MIEARNKLASLVERRIGLRLGPVRRSDPVIAFLEGAAHRLHLPSAEAYVAHLANRSEDDEEFVALVSVVTNGQTHFLRHREQLDSILVAVKERARHRRPVTIWSAGCSTGEEPYSLAILCREAGLPVVIVGTDVDRERLETARSARYSPWALRHVPPEVAERYFEKGPHDYHLKNEIRRAVTFREHNLCGGSMLAVEGGGHWDIIVCRNVFIYLGRQRTAAITTQMTDVLHEEGWIFLGPSDSLHGSDVPLKAVRVDPYVAYRPPAAIRGDHASEYPVTSPLPPVRRSIQPVYLEVPGDAALPTRTDPMVEGEPAAWHASMNLGNDALRAHEFQKALDAYERARDIDPLPAEVHFMTALVHVKLGDQEEARELLRRALFLEPDHHPAALLLAGVYERLGQADTARRELQHLDSILADSKGGVLFRSEVTGIPAATITRDEAREQCRMRLSMGAEAAGRN